MGRWSTALNAALAATAVLGTLALVPAAEAARKPTKKERAGIIAGVRAGNKFMRQTPKSCDRAAIVRVSTADRRYALWTQNNALAARISRKCAIGDGFIILRFQPNKKWRIRWQGSGAAPCHVLGVRIARGLTGLSCG